MSNSTSKPSPLTVTNGVFVRLTKFPVFIGIAHTRYESEWAFVRALFYQRFLAIDIHVQIVRHSHYIVFHILLFFKSDAKVRKKMQIVKTIANKFALSLGSHSL